MGEQELQPHQDARVKQAEQLVAGLIAQQQTRTSASTVRFTVGATYAGLDRGKGIGYYFTRTSSGMGFRLSGSALDIRVHLAPADSWDEDGSCLFYGDSQLRASVSTPADVSSVVFCRCYRFDEKEDAWRLVIAGPAFMTSDYAGAVLVGKHDL